MKTPKLNKKKIGMRLFASPFIFGMLTVAYTRSLFIHFYHVMLYGGEWITYKPEDAKTVLDIYNLIKEQNPNPQIK